VCWYAEVWSTISENGVRVRRRREMGTAVGMEVMHDSWLLSFPPCNDLSRTITASSCKNAVTVV
jgi:hypothetical protein